MDYSSNEENSDEGVSLEEMKEFMSKVQKHKKIEEILNSTSRNIIEEPPPKNQINISIGSSSNKNSLPPKQQMRHIKHHLSERKINRFISAFNYRQHFMKILTYLMFLLTIYLFSMYLSWHQKEHKAYLFVSLCIKFELVFIGMLEFFYAKITSQSHKFNNYSQQPMNNTPNTRIIAWKKIKIELIIIGSLGGFVNILFLLLGNQLDWIIYWSTVGGGSLGIILLNSLIIREFVLIKAERDARKRLD